MTDYETRLRALELASAPSLGETPKDVVARASIYAGFLGVRDVPVSQTVRDAIALAIRTLEEYASAGYATAEAMNALSEALALIDGDVGGSGD